MGTHWNSIQYVKKRCNTEFGRIKSMEKLESKLQNNGFSTKNKRKHKSKRKRKEKNKNLAFFKLGFVNDKTDRKIRKLIHKYDLPVTFVSSSNQNLHQALKNKQEKKKHKNCFVCDLLPNKVKCTDRFLVYKFTCKCCQDFYIGQTSRPFKLRYNEHKRAVSNSCDSSALSEHCKKCNCSQIDDFGLDIIGMCKDALNTRLTEARQIKQLNPKLNRKKEMTVF